MTTPTPAQIEALKAIERLTAASTRTFDGMIRDMGLANDLARAALTAAAEVGDEWVRELERKGIASLIDEAVADERERCAQVVKEWEPFVKDRNGLLAAIRALKDK